MTGGRSERNVTFADLAAVVECEKGPFFVKAMRNRPGGRRDSIVREEVINPFVRAVSPALLWAAYDDHWIALGFEIVDGRRANLRPGSPDLPAVVGLLNASAELECPDAARDWPETRWDRFAATAGEAELFRGDSLLHADINHTNLLIGDRAWAVDWGWPTRGAGFIDPATLVVQLVSGGHTPEAAESWAARCTAWSEAAPKAIDAFAAAEVRMWREMAERRPGRPARRALADAAEAWAEHRGVAGL
ncbi:protein kinase [Streptomyces sp. DSM 44917]|uniref:Protein kinase n=1 Tax=Streptomyces boetiae TaxID=3075541 RepID=A0ABU2L4A0_9ACTN|nr:protein kinase [Streptomyces sp. DSM 44917]MDT0306068.1 protein kinase [Streptomyces sp. DSM 44917]